MATREELVAAVEAAKAAYDAAYAARGTRGSRRAHAAYDAAAAALDLYDRERGPEQARMTGTGPAVALPDPTGERDRLMEEVGRAGRFGMYYD